MQVSVTFRHMESTEALKDHCTERVHRITKFMPQATTAHVILCVEKLTHVAEVLIDGGAFHCRGEAKTDDMYRSIDDAVSKIERQVKRYSEKIHNHKPRHAPPKELAVNHHVFALPTEAAEKNVDHQLIDTKKIMAKEMSVDDAVMQMDLIGNTFLVFQNVDSKLLSVLYRRDGGHFGLIEATTR